MIVCGDLLFFYDGSDKYSNIQHERITRVSKLQCHDNSYINDVTFCSVYEKMIEKFNVKLNRVKVSSSRYGKLCNVSKFILSEEKSVGVCLS